MKNLVVGVSEMTVYVWSVYRCTGYYVVPVVLPCSVDVLWACLVRDFHQPPLQEREREERIIIYFEVRKDSVVQQYVYR